MSKKNSKKKRRQKPNSNKTIKQNSPTKKQRLQQLLSAGFAKFVVFVTIVSALYFFYPRVSILKSEQLFPYNPFKNPFYVYNSGNIPITNFEYYLFAPYVEIVGNNKFIDSTMKMKTKMIEHIGIEKKSFISLEKTFKMPPSYVKKANIEVVWKNWTET